MALNSSFDEIPVCFSTLDLRACVPVDKNAIPQEIDLDKRLNLAEKPISLRRQWIAEGAAKKTTTNLLLNYVRKYLDKNKFQEKKYWNAVNMIIANAFYAYGHKGQTLYSRDTTHKKNVYKNPENITNTTVMNVVDALTHYGFLQGAIGKANEYEKVKSWFECTDKLISVFKQSEIFIRQSRNSPEIELRNENKDPTAIPKKKAILCAVKRLKRPVSDFNAFWLEHNATLDGALVVPFLHRIFNINFEWGGRFYGAYQTIPKADRKRILINGQPTVELDYSGLHINLMYAEKGLPFVGDVYKGIGHLDPSLSETENRSLLKLLMLKFINSDDIAAFKRNVTKSSNPKNKEVFNEYSKKRSAGVCEKSLRKKFPQLEGFVEGVPNGLDGETVMNMILNAHPQIADLFNQERIGSKLQFKDSEIMSSCLMKLIEMKIPALPVHDSIICPVGYECLVSHAMQEAYSENTSGQKILIK